MADRNTDRRTGNTNSENNGLAERNITADDMKKYKNALDSQRSYVSGDEEWSSSSRRFTDL